MKRKLLGLLIAVLLIIIVFSGCLEENKSKTVGIITVPLNTININIIDILEGYILDNETYSDNPPIWNDREAIDTYGLTYISTTQGSNDTIRIWLVRHNSSMIAKESLFDFVNISGGLANTFLDEIYCKQYDRIGDDSIVKAHLDFNTTSINLIFRIKNIVGFAQKYVSNLSINKFEFVYSTLYVDYCNETWEYAKAIEEKINPFIVYVEGEEPEVKILEIKEIKNSPTGKTVVFSAENYIEDLMKSKISGFRGMFSFHEPNGGDTLILRDNISMINYEPLYDDTVLSLSSLLDIYVQGNINDTYDVGDEIEITLHIMEVDFSYVGEDYSIKLIEETWHDLNYYLYYQTLVDTIDTLLPQDIIQKI